jgi:hypothetical protein
MDNVVGTGYPASRVTIADCRLPIAIRQPYAISDKR